MSTNLMVFRGGLRSALNALVKNPNYIDACKLSSLPEMMNLTTDQFNNALYHGAGFTDGFIQAAYRLIRDNDLPAARKFLQNFFNDTTIDFHGDSPEIHSPDQDVRDIVLRALKDYSHLSQQAVDHMADNHLDAGEIDAEISTVIDIINYFRRYLATLYHRKADITAPKSNPFAGYNPKCTDALNASNTPIPGE